jgi:hypothetical protein
MADTPRAAPTPAAIAPAASQAPRAAPASPGAPPTPTATGSYSAPALSNAPALGIQDTRRRSRPSTPAAPLLSVLPGACEALPTTQLLPLAALARAAPAPVMPRLANPPTAVASVATAAAPDPEMPAAKRGCVGLLELERRVQRLVAAVAAPGSDDVIGARDDLETFMRVRIKARDVPVLAAARYRLATRVDLVFEALCIGHFDELFKEGVIPKRAHGDRLFSAAVLPFFARGALPARHATLLPVNAGVASLAPAARVAPATRGAAGSAAFRAYPSASLVSCAASPAASSTTPAAPAQSIVLSTVPEAYMQRFRVRRYSYAHRLNRHDNEGLKSPEKAAHAATTATTAGPRGTVVVPAVSDDDDAAGRQISGGEDDGGDEVFDDVDEAAMLATLVDPTTAAELDAVAELMGPAGEPSSVAGESADNDVALLPPWSEQEPWFRQLFDP